MKGPWADESDENACSLLRREFDRFVEGQMVSLALHPFKKEKDAFLAILNPPEDRVFGFRVREPNPGLRVFGCFADPDVFVATNWERRDRLPSVTRGELDNEEWAKERQICLARWRQVAAAYQPHMGKTINDYITGNVIPA